MDVSSANAHSCETMLVKNSSYDDLGSILKYKYIF